MSTHSRRAVLAGIAASPALAAPALASQGDTRLRELWALYQEKLAAEQAIQASIMPARAAYDAEEVDGAGASHLSKANQPIWEKHGLDRLYEDWNDAGRAHALGAHTIAAVAVDTSGNYATSSINVTVAAQSPTWTPTDAPQMDPPDPMWDRVGDNFVPGTLQTFTNVIIGTPESDRIVVVGVGGLAASIGTFISAAIDSGGGPVPMTLVDSTSSAQFSNQQIGLFYARFRPERKRQYPLLPQLR
jgi:hypothetical protein